MKYLISFALILGAKLAVAGTAVSGGGGAFVCRDGNRTIQRSMLVDLWESENTFFNWPYRVPGTDTNGTISIPKNNSDMLGQLSKAMSNLKTFDSFLASDVSFAVREIYKYQQFLPDGISLTLPNDLLTDYFPTGCPPEGMLRFNDHRFMLDIKKDIFEKLESNTDLAAAYLHEGIYKVFRDSFDDTQNSILLRRLVGCLFSDECVQKSLALNKKSFFPEGPYYDRYSCISADGEYQLYRFNHYPPTVTEGKDWQYKIIRIKNLKFGVPVTGVAHFDNCNKDGSKCVAGKNNNANPLKDPSGWFATFGFHPLVLDQFEITRSQSSWEIKSFNPKNAFMGSRNPPKPFGELTPAKCTRVQ